VQAEFSGGDITNASPYQALFFEVAAKLKPG
jgi:hypothetical protein